MCRCETASFPTRYESGVADLPGSDVIGSMKPADTRDAVSAKSAFPKSAPQPSGYPGQR